MRHYWQCKDYRDYLRFENSCLLALLGYKHQCCETLDPHHFPPLSTNESDDSDCLPFCRIAHRLYDTDRETIVGLLERSNVQELKRGYLRGFLTFLGLQSQKPVQRVPNKKKAEEIKTSRFQTKIGHSSKRGKGSATHPLKVPNYNQQ